MALLGVICGADGWDALELFASLHAPFLSRCLDMPKGTPSADTFRRVFEALDPRAFQAAFQAWLKPSLDELEGKTIALDGKTLRGALAHAAGKGPFHLLHAWATEERILLGQVATNRPSDEPAAALEMLRLLELDGATVTADANFCTSELTAAIREARGDFVLALKGNRDALYDHVQRRFAEAARDGAAVRESSTTSDRGHGRDFLEVLATGMPSVQMRSP